MSQPSQYPVLHVPARDVPVPPHLSPEARAMLSADGMSSPPWPAADDVDAWRRTIEAMDARRMELLGPISQTIRADVEELTVDGARVYAVTPADLAADDSAIYLDFHGGSLVWGGGASCRAMARIVSAMVEARVWSVDYRMPPDHPYPAAVDDGVAVYRALLRETPPEKIVIGGASAGGNVAAATILRARDEGLPLPAAAVLLTPEVDLTESGDTFHTLLGVDTALTRRLMPANLLYASGHDLRDPYLSPLFGDFTEGFPPTFLQSGTRDLFLSNTVRMHAALRAADVEADLHVQEAAPHVGFAFCPEARHRDREVLRFVNRHWRRAAD